MLYSLLARWLDTGVSETFGKFLKRLFEDLGTSPEKAEGEPEIKVGRRQIYNWFEMETLPDKGDADVQLSDYLAIPLRHFRAVIAGEEELESRYRDRDDWLVRQAARRRRISEGLSSLAATDAHAGSNGSLRIEDFKSKSELIAAVEKAWEDRQVKKVARRPKK